MKRLMSGVLLWLCVLAAATAQESLDRYYAYPLSFGAGYTPLTPVAGVNRRATVNGLAGEFRIPIPGSPVLQPYVAGGVLTFDSDEADGPTIVGGTLDADASMPDYDTREVWDHSYFYGALGFGYARRLTKEFELGVDGSVGVGQSIFNRRFVTAAGEWLPVGAIGLSFGLGAKISLNPSYNFNISIAPSLRYELGLSAMRDFDGLYFGVGIGANYRVGRDPDAPMPDIRAIRVGDLEMPPVFAAMQSVYVNEPVTGFTVTNTAEEAITDVAVSFNQPGFMDSPTLSAKIDSLGPGESAAVPVHASFNRAVFSTNGITPLNGELIFQYTYANRPVEQRQSVAYDLHDRNALTWDDDRKVAAFVTSSDSAIRNYASFIRSSARNDGTDYFPEPLEFGMQAYHALAGLGLLYQPDPTSPFTQVQENTLIVDSIGLPRQTLRSITGDCDDLTVLYDAMLESVGVKSGFVTIPGHIYSAINTGVPAEEYSRIHPDAAMTMEHEGSLWILVEITLVGQSSFVEAWRTGMRQWHAYDGRPDARAFYTTAQSQRVYRAVGLTETDLGLQYGDPETFLAAYRTDLERLSAEVLRPAMSRAESRNSPRTWNQVGVLAGRLRDYNAASRAFDTAARLDSRYISPLVNRGSLEYLQGHYDAAIGSYRQAENIVSLNPDAVSDDVAVSLYLNLSRVLYEVSDFDAAAEAADIAQAINAEQVERFGRTAQTDSEGGRASQADAGSILFVDDAEE